MLVLLFAVPQSHAQSVAWTRSAYGTTVGDAMPFCDESPRSAYSRAVDASGNVFVTGCAFNGANNDILTYKVNGATGAILWSVTYNGSGNGDDAGLALALDASGNVAVTGYSVDAVGGVNIRTIKYNGATGAEIWNSSFNDVQPGSIDEGVAIAFDANGNVLVTGSSQPAIGNTDMRTIKYGAASGNELWSVRYDGPTTGYIDAARAIAVDSNNDVVIAGISNTASGVSNLRVIKYSGVDGAQFWEYAQASSGDSFAEANSVAIDSSGNVLVTGTCRSTSTTEICTSKLDGSNGARLWAASFTDVNSDTHAGNAVIVDHANNVLVAGHSRGAGGDIYMRTIKYEGSTGAELWNSLRNTPGDANAIAVDSVDNVLVTGFSGNGFYLMNTVKYAKDGDVNKQGVLLWSTFSGAGGDHALAVAVDASNNVIVTGTSSDASGRLSIKTYKYDTANFGTELWATPAGNPAVTTGVVPASLPFSSKAMAADSMGNVIVTGYIVDGESSESMRTIKYSAATGAELWSVAYKGDSTFLGGNRGQALVLDAAGNAYVTGYSSDASGDRNIRTTKYAAATGAVVWTAPYDGTSNSYDEGNAITLDPSGNVLVTGYSSEASGGRNMITVKYNGATGSTMWPAPATFAGASSLDDSGYSVATDATGNVFVTGYSKDMGTPPFIRTVKYRGSDGFQLWTSSFRGPQSTTGRAFALAVDSTGNAFVSGTSADTSISGYENFRTIKYDGSTGGEIWNVAYDGLSHANDMASGLAVDVSSGDVVVTGSSSEPDALSSTFAIRTMKYRSTDGVLLWTSAYVGSGGRFSSGTAVVTDAAKNVIVSGYSTDNNQGLNIRTIKYRGTTGAEMFNLSYNGSANGDDSGVTVARAPGAYFVLGTSLESGKPLAWVVRKINDDSALGAPTISNIIAGNGQATIEFTPPSQSGGSALVGYTVSCTGGFSRTGSGSPLTVTGLANGNSYDCSVTASTLDGPGPASATMSVTPSAAAPLALVAVQSRKTHGGAGAFDLPVNRTIPVGGAVSIEPRVMGLGHSLVFQFNNTVSSPGAAAIQDAVGAPLGSAPTVTYAGFEVTVTFAGIGDRQRAQVSLTGVNGSLNAQAALGFLQGDVSSSGYVTAADISALKAHLAKPLDAFNFRYDLDVSGSIDSSDVAMARTRSGQGLQ